MTIRESKDFYFDGIYSVDMGISNVNVSSGMQEEFFVANRQIFEQTIKGRNKPYFQYIKDYPLVFDVNFAFDEVWDESKIRNVARWLIQPYYKPLYFSDNINRIYYAMVIDDPILVHNSLKQGYVKLRFRCDSPYTYSPVYISDLYDLSSNPVEGTVIQFTNSGDVDLYPEISITKISAGNVSIINQTNGNREFEFTGLSNAEELYIDCENQYIESNLPGIYRYDAFNDNYLFFVRGINNLLITGTCTLRFRYQLKLIQG